MQDGNTRDHLWGVAETIAKLSEGTTLHAGTLISMGTPPGEGFKRDPQVFLKHGDVVTISGCEFAPAAAAAAAAAGDAE
jgi:2-keto-4-pentenoate hydratase/2-oxohepta-3-ene-1,7-dioic acid hydratase in catechol pathway